MTIGSFACRRPACVFNQTPCIVPAGVEIISNGSGSHHQLRKLNQVSRCGR